MSAAEESSHIRNRLTDNVPDKDPQETQDWIESFDGMLEERGTERAEYIMRNLLQRASSKSVSIPMVTTTDYVNTIPADQEPDYPGDEELERRYRNYLRWNAAMIVQHAQREGIEVGGHISSYAGQATLYEVGLNHFFRGPDHPGGGDQVFFQGHSSPGNYARAFLEGRLTEEDLDGFRQEKSKGDHGLPSYPHPRMMSDFWQFPTVSMGIGPLNAIQQAQVNRYLHNRGIKDTSEQHVWAFLGDGEMDEPESRGALHIAANDKLDNLTFVINCNLQRLDGPVRGNGKIVQELEAYFHGAGWNVIKVLWGREWDPLLEADDTGELVRIMNETPDGDYQTYKAEDGAFVREHFFGRSSTTKELVADMSDDEIWGLKRGGHDYKKVYAAYDAALKFKGKPTVILAHTIKGYGLGTHFEGRNATHQMKKLTVEDIKVFRDRHRIPISDEQIEADPYHVPYYHPGPDAPEIKYMMERREALGGFLPQRRENYDQLAMPDEKLYKHARKGSGKQEVATTMAFVRLLRDIMRDKNIGQRIVPIIPDEARTFGMDSFFPTAKIYNPRGQNYMAVDRDLFLSYKESSQGQLLHVGINEAGATGAMTALGTSYATHGEIMIPIYIFYSMFGFQRTGDLVWAATDQLARGFMIGATAGRTTLTGEGTQHMDGHSPILAATNPAVRHYDPAFSYEIAHIVRHGLDVMYGDHDGDPLDRDVLFYLTVYNEPIVHPEEPEDLDVESLLKGIYRYSVSEHGGPKVNLFGSGVSLPWVIEAAELLADDWGVSADVWSVPSWTELRREAVATEHYNFMHPDEQDQVPYITQVLQDVDGPIVATTDYVTLLPDQLRPYIPNRFAVLGADGFGFADTRAAARRYFTIDAHSTVVRALKELEATGEVPEGTTAQAFAQYRIDDVAAGTTGTAGGDA
ncbi:MULTISPECIES: pyruvate dehydrogenase (acetyl-transferring), homodimeric type [Auritidibacter]|uniref:pyruvate dehydrogenase (acetyl-transferring), homodimeric type n=1 Tax=Auritidibacter TaxID=1160973 RepID=UPI000D727600|nr:MULTISPECIES: pyruvate dehydrogenase (acetyl-transferring), homodimeric type [Auritidibacter]PXA79293.1 pyruvate dehydrogenase (acetyl-transferring), homodimeric type [Auritidibacter sp. NML120779]AXR73330.1 pyruvate dehydrogenase (acetyl-transferring), homodimeric type [Auritidibacter sp. NML130574]NIH70896.1 pyruvate dehydrogenase E1 component [Auritidibacter ignavus]PXA82085.1 pyruvate dehydrogenase (acetyl-transferring), homodimeric type [Auritidibacter sp. NML120636]RMX24066.1 pyruvate